MTGETSAFARLLVGLCWLVTPAILWAQSPDSNADREVLPSVPEGFRVTLFAREPLVRQPCSMAFDARGRLFVGMGPQYRHPKPETPGDSVVMILDTDADGIADTRKVFATGFNAVQGLAWHGLDLWVANAPDLTVVRDRDGDDEADEYVRVYTDLGNLEHGLHGLNWAPDGKLYMSKGNSKGLTQPGRIAPKPFRDLWGVTAPPGSPDFPEPQVYPKQDYRHAYHDPADDWGREGGILRCDEGGKNLEIVARGFRNPWDITMDSGFNWLGTDNDQTTGDRVFMPFYGAHFGWNHSWSSHWSTEPHPPTAPVSGPLFEGSGTGVVFYDSPQFPPDFRRVFFINDWLRKTTFVWRPEWDGALLRPKDGHWEPFIEGGQALYRPTDLEVGPDGALWILGWGSGYGAEWKNGKLTNEGRIFRIAWEDAPPRSETAAQRKRPFREGSVSELIADFAEPLPIWRTNAQAELLRRGAAVKNELLQSLERGNLTESQETWITWTLGRMALADHKMDEFFQNCLTKGSTANLNRQIQAVRILAHRIRESQQDRPLPGAVIALLRSDQPRLRLAAVQALMQAKDKSHARQLIDLLATERDPTIFYAGWQALRRLSREADLQALLSDSRAGVRRAALLALAETHALAQTAAERLAKDHEIAALWLTQTQGAKPVMPLRGRPLASSPRSASDEPIPSSGVSLIRNLQVRSGQPYRSVPGGLTAGRRNFIDRDYRLKQVPEELSNAELIQTANNDDGSKGRNFLSFEALVPVRVYVGIDTRMPRPPAWVFEEFERSKQQIRADHWTYELYHRDFATGPIRLGGNTDNGQTGGKSHYLIALEPQPLLRSNPSRQSPKRKQVIAHLPMAESARGEILFRHPQGAGCIKCHSLNENSNGFGPNLGDIGRRASRKHIIQAILDPSAVITEGFPQHIIITNDGQVHSGVLLEESGLALTLGLASGERLTVRKDSIDERKTSQVSAMPAIASQLTPLQIADLTAFLLEQKAPVTNTRDSRPQTNGFHIEERPGRLILSFSGKPVGEFVYRDDKIRRPYFANLRAPGGMRVTRHHPPRPGVDATDHATMHPGIWLGLGDVSGSDFWRNQGRIEHVQFLGAPTADKSAIRFATESRFVSNAGTEICRLTSRFLLADRPAGWLLIWDARFRSDHRDFTFGDQEEMGFGARVATPLTEKNGGVITNSQGQKSAAQTWGQPAAWCDYSGKSKGQSGGITLMPDPSNFRKSWWHNRDYGVFVANPFGRAAMKQGAKSHVTVKRGEPFRIRFAAVLHDSADNQPEAAYQDCLKQLKLRSSDP